MKEKIFIAIVYITAALILLHIAREMLGLDISQAPRLGD